MKHPLTLIGLLLIGTTVWGQAGRMDPSYNVGTGTNDGILAMALDQDGKTVIGGVFSALDGTVRNHVARLNTDGSLDLAFDPGPGANAAVFAVAVQADGKILIGGSFTSYNGVARSRMARLNDDGTLDLGFEALGVMDQTVRCIALQPDGKIVIGGTFTNFNGTAANSIARLNADGSQDLTFDPGTGATGAVSSNPNVYAVAVQPDGKIILAGSFSQYNGVARNAVTRINSDGSLDTGFNPQDPNGIGGANGRVTCLALQPDGKILIGGFFTTYNNASRKYVARLNSDGSLNHAFDPSPGPNSYLETLAVQSDGSIVMGGAFVSYSGQTAYLLTRSLSNGDVDPSFNTNFGVTGTGPHVRCVVIQPDGSIVFGGSFSSYQGVAGNNIARVLGGEVLRLTLTTDANASETSWELLAVNDSVLVSGGPYADGAPMVVEESIPVEAGCYKLRVLDAGGNGMTNGGYMLTNGIGQRIIDADGQFGSVSSTDTKFCVPLGPVGLTSEYCDDTAHSASEEVKCSEVPNAIGYQFWFFDPHGSFQYRTTSTGNRVGPNRIAQLPTDLELNVRVRALLSDSSYTEFGPACKLMVTGSGMAPQELRSAKAATDMSISIWPNPLSEELLQLNVNGLEPDVTSAHITLLDALGRSACSMEIPVANGSANRTLDLGDVSNGMYLFQLTVNGNVTTSRLAINR